MVQALTEGFHTFGLLWTPDEYVYFVDGVETWRVRAKDGGPISHRAEHIILSLEVGDWAGKIDGATLPDSMVVDWVRVWRKSGTKWPRIVWISGLCTAAFWAACTEHAGLGDRTFTSRTTLVHPFSL